MHTLEIPADADRAEIYRELLPSLRSLVADEPDLIANLANLSAALYQAIPGVSWVGFYRQIGDELVLGPFQGKLACTRIARGRGVCGAAAERAATVVVADVEAFPGHIACDAASRSEIVVPVLRDGRVLAVLDVDSDRLANFDAVDAEHLAQVAALAAALAW
ncbi:MAG: GAF domain-containing protein [Myxococcales bacterium]|nr:GAF domain-containing protein [Myxococcales bacterium]